MEAAVNRALPLIRSLDELGFRRVMDVLEVQSRARAELDRARARLLLDSQVELPAPRQP